MSIVFVRCSFVLGNGENNRRKTIASVRDKHVLFADCGC